MNTRQLAINLILSGMLILSMVLPATPNTNKPSPTLSTSVETLTDCGIVSKSYIDPEDGFLKTSLHNNCSDATGFTVAVYSTDGTVNRTRRYCYAAGESGIVTIGKGDWIAKVEIENVTDC